MRKYEVEYYAEVNDQCEECLAIVEYENIIQLVNEFKFHFKNCKRIIKITEV